MVTRRRIFNKYLIAGVMAGAGVTFQTLAPNSLLSSTDSSFINGVVRSTRALFTITSTVIDYKFSLYGLNESTDKYRLTLSELHLRSAKRILTMCEANKEARNLERIRENFEGNSMVRVPNVFWDFTTRQVLIMEFCRGRKVDDLDFLKERGISVVKVAKTLAEVFAEMIFVHGFLHGDLHPGNILVTPEGKNGFSLVLLDFGICKQLDEDFRLKYCELWEALIVKDSIKIQEIGEYFGVGKYARYFPVIFTGRTIDSKSALGEAMSVEERMNLKQELKSLKMDDISSFMESLPTDFLTVLRTDGLLRSLISKLGAPLRVRLLAYAEYALYGLSLKADSKSDSVVGVMLVRFKTGLRYVQLRLLFGILGLVSWLQSIKHTSTRRFKDFLASACYVVRNLYHPLLTAY